MRQRPVLPVPRLGPHAELVARRPGLVEPEPSCVLPQPGVLRGVCEVARVGVGRRPVDVLEVDGRLACDGVLRVARWRGVPDSLPDVALVAGDQPADEDGNLVSRRSVARLDKQPTARMLARERVVQRGVLLEDVPWDVLVAQRPPLAVLGVLLAGHRDQVGRYRLEIPCIGRVHPVVAWPQACSTTRCPSSRNSRSRSKVMTGVRTRSASSWSSRARNPRSSASSKDRTGTATGRCYAAHWRQ